MHGDDQFTVEMILTGHYAGRDIVLNGRVYRGGVHRVTVKDLRSVSDMIRYHRRSYQVEIKINGQLQNDPSAQSGGSKTVSDPSGQDGSRPAPQNAAGSNQLAEAGDRNSGMDPHRQSGPGTDAASVEAAEFRKKAVSIALERLDHSVDDHWTQGGKPQVSVVAEMAGIQDLKRSDIDAVAPGLVREVEETTD